MNCIHMIEVVVETEVEVKEEMEVQMDLSHSVGSRREPKYNNALFLRENPDTQIVYRLLQDNTYHHQLRIVGI